MLGVEPKNCLAFPCMVLWVWPICLTVIVLTLAHLFILKVIGHLTK